MSAPRATSWPAVPTLRSTQANPLRRTSRIALTVGFTPERNEQIGIRKNRLHKLELRLHKTY